MRVVFLHLYEIYKKLPSYRLREQFNNSSMLLCRCVEMTYHFIKLNRY
jgi:hypothetical protein